MRFNFLIIALLSVLFAARCSGPRTFTKNPNSLGPTDQDDDLVADAFQTATAQGNYAWMLDRTRKQLLIFTMNPFALQTSADLPNLAQKSALVLGKDGNFIFMLSDDDLYIIHSNGTMKINPINIIGKLKNLSYDDKLGLALISDDLGSLAFLKLDDQGKVIDQWESGPVLSGSFEYESGIMVGGGMLAMKASKNEIALLDVSETIHSKSISIKTLPAIDLTEINWIGSDRSAGDHLLVQSETKLISYSLKEQKVTQSIDLSPSKVIKRVKSKASHLIASSDSASYVDVYSLQAGGTIKKFVLRSPQSSYGKTFLDHDSGSFFYLLGHETADRTLYKLRIQDSLVQSEIVVPMNSEVAVSPEFAVIVYPSSLGYAERLGYGRQSERKAISGYNVDL